MNRDIDKEIEKLAIYPAIKVKQLKVTHPADDDGIWFFSCNNDVEVQLESSTGNLPFLLESTAHDRRVEINSIDEAVSKIRNELKASAS